MGSWSSPKKFDAAPSRLMTYCHRSDDMTFWRASSDSPLSASQAMAPLASLR